MQSSLNTQKPILELEHEFIALKNVEDIPKHNSFIVSLNCYFLRNIFNFCHKFYDLNMNWEKRLFRNDFCFVISIEMDNESDIFFNSFTRAV